MFVFLLILKFVLSDVSKYLTPPSFLIQLYLKEILDKETLKEIWYLCIVKFDKTFYFYFICFNKIRNNLKLNLCYIELFYCTLIRVYV